MINKTKVCPECNDKFQCGTCDGDGCWCSEYPAIMPFCDVNGCYCPKCLNKIVGDKIKTFMASGTRSEDLLNQIQGINKSSILIEELDYYVDDNQNWVFTSWYHLKRGYCCKHGCKNCPYEFDK